MTPKRILPALVCKVVAILMLSTSAAWCQAQGPALDLVLANGRIIDPETKLDAIRNLGIKDGKIAAISETQLKGQVVVDVTGLVVAPGAFVIQDGELDTKAFPGQPVRRTVSK